MNEPALPPDTLDGHCLAEEVIYALACGGLEANERSRALAHLDDCELCQALLADEVRGLPEFAAPDSAPTTLIHVGALVGGRYRIKRFVARGGMGEVYEAWDVFLSERVALKTINPLAASADQIRASARFKQEVQLSRRVADPHVCRIYEFGHHVVPRFGTLAYLTMEFIEGQTLGARLRKGERLRLDEVVELCRQMLRGLAAAHAVGVLHRDLKSENVMLRANAASPGPLHAVIMDFGLARLLGDQAHLLTERHELVGSAAYMAPEQLEEGAALSQATDVYAFGVVLFEMLTGRLPFDGKSAVAIAMRRLTQRAPAPSSLVPELSVAWDELVLGCLERDVNRRLSSTQEVAAALEAVAHASAVLRRPQRRRGVVLTAIASAALVVGVLYLSARRGKEAAAARAAAEAQQLTLTLQPAPRVEPAAAAPSPATPAAISPSNGAPELAVPLEPAHPLVPALETEPVPPPAVPKRAARRTPSAPTSSAAVPSVNAGSSPVADAAQRPSTEDVRELFFLEGPNEGQPQNSKK